MPFTRPAADLRAAVEVLAGLAGPLRTDAGRAVPVGERTVV
jgi:hypothetical protein